MKRFILSLLLLISGYWLPAQDTVFIDMQDAVKISMDNYTPQYIFNETFSGNSYELILPVINPGYFSLTAWQPGMRKDLSKIFKHNSLPEITKAWQQLEHSKSALSKKQLGLYVKSAYMHWIYLYNKLQNISTRREYLQKYYEAASLKYEFGEISLLEKLQVETLVSEVETEYISCLYDIELNMITLQKKMNTKNYLLPANKSFELYMINKRSDTSDFKGNLIIDIYTAQNICIQTELNNLKRRFLPAKNYGILYMETTKQNLEQAKHDIELEMESLKLKLDKYFLNIRHFQNYALPLANSTINDATIAYKLEEIEVGEYIDKIFIALKKKSEYLNFINEYNQTALRLEFYAY